MEAEGCLSGEEKRAAEVGRLTEVDSALVQAWEVFRHGWKRVWWEAIARPSDVPPEEEAEFLQQFQDLASESSSLLALALPQVAQQFPVLFTPQVYGSIIGMFELNNLALVVDPPVENYFLHIDDLPEQEKVAAQVVTQPILDMLDKDYDIPCEGTGFFPSQACMNHSCAPNTHAQKREEDKDGRAVLLALRPISVGEELTISYVDESLSLSKRRNALKDYGFVCSCPRCIDEESRKKSKSKKKIAR